MPGDAEPVTYALAGPDGDSSRFLEALGRLTDRTLAEVSGLSGDVVHAHMRRVERDRIERLRSTEEYTFEFLAIGVLWREYGARALAVPVVVLAALASLVRLRRAHPSWKRGIDRVRAFGAARYFDPGRVTPHPPALPSTEDLRHLVLWLEATGEYREESARFRMAVDTIAAHAPARQAVFIHALIEAARRMSVDAATTLHAWTPNVDSFAARARTAYRGREDYVLACRGEADYHLSMIGAEIMNRRMRDDFQATGRRIVLLPGCMRGMHAASCRARREGFDLRCMGCTGDCRVHMLQRQGRHDGFAVRIIPHSSDFSRWLRTRVAGTGTGVVGVACIPNLLGGGYELRALDIPSQCVFLNGCGCAAHWHPSGIETNLDEATLRAIATSGHTGCR